MNVIYSFHISDLLFFLLEKVEAMMGVFAKIIQAQKCKLGI